MGDELPIDETLLFVLSPIGEDGSAIRKRADDVLHGIIKPAAELAQLRAIRADDSDKPGAITTSIVESIISARVIVADLTGRNPNVFFELGVADAYGKPVILLVDATANLPFDKMGDRAIAIGGDSESRIGASDCEPIVKRLHRTLEAVIAPDYVVRNVVTSVGISRSVDALARGGDPVAAQLESLTDAVRELRNERLPLTFRYDPTSALRGVTGLNFDPSHPLLTYSVPQPIAQTSGPEEILDMRMRFAEIVGADFRLLWSTDRSRVTVVVRPENVVNDTQFNGLGVVAGEHGFQFGGVKQSHDLNEIS